MQCRRGACANIMEYSPFSDRVKRNRAGFGLGASLEMMRRSRQGLDRAYCTARVASVFCTKCPHAAISGRAPGLS